MKKSFCRFLSRHGTVARKLLCYRGLNWFYTNSFVHLTVYNVYKACLIHARKSCTIPDLRANSRQLSLNRLIISYKTCVPMPSNNCSLRNFYQIIFGLTSNSELKILSKYEAVSYLFSRFVNGVYSMFAPFNLNYLQRTVFAQSKSKWTDHCSFYL